MNNLELKCLPSTGLYYINLDDGRGVHTKPHHGAANSLLEPIAEDLGVRMQQAASVLSEPAITTTKIEWGSEVFATALGAKDE